MPIENQFPTGAVIKAGTSIASGIFGYIGAKKQQQRAYDLSERSAENAYKRNLEQYHRANLYNNPSSNMARLKAAGLNPNLVYGTGSATQTAAPSPQKESVQAKFHQPPTGIPQGIETFQNVRMQEVTIESIQEQTEATRLANLKAAIDLGETGGTNLYQANAYNKMLENMDRSVEQQFKTIQAQERATQAVFETKVMRLKGELADSGITPNDNVFARAIIAALKNTDYSIESLTAMILKKFLPRKQ